jgi:hypothetical protein
MVQTSTAQCIDDLVVATCPPEGSRRQAYVLRQALQALVRQARAEYLMEMRADVARLSGVEALQPRRRGTRAILLRIAQGCDARQQRFEFDRDDKAS